MDRFSQEAAVIQSLKAEVAGLLKSVDIERRKTTASEARTNKLAIENLQLIRQHEQDVKRIDSLTSENTRLSRRCRILESALNQLAGDPGEIKPCSERP